MVTKDQTTERIRGFLLKVEHNGQQQFYQFVKQILLTHVEGIEHKLFGYPIYKKKTISNTLKALPSEKTYHRKSTDMKLEGA